MLEHRGFDTLAKLKSFLAEKNYSLHSRLPPERYLCQQLGISRTALRKALAVLESEGQIWRHVGRGTFIGSRPVENTNEVAFISNRTTPAEVMDTRLLIEPGLARLAALHATTADIEQMRQCIRKSKATNEWRVYEAWDNNLHRAIARAAHNRLLLSLFDTLNSVRREVVWGRPRTNKLTLAHHSYAQHDTIVQAIANRDVDLAATCMHEHLEMVRDNLLKRTPKGDDDAGKSGR